MIFLTDAEIRDLRATCRDAVVSALGSKADCSLCVFPTHVRLEIHLGTIGRGDVGFRHELLSATAAGLLRHLHELIKYHGAECPASLKSALVAEMLSTMALPRIQP